ncbi:conserved hypothetical protein [Coccidioides posadasii str. Silveira]|uniref:Uncharacterized protein n=1 Tax=Coccidioides posadasii (strain RMSCC 757 / Silveira) TaxID=443226 RepID=E9DBW8_COCPS|nr:conserved hypothetical protein [Coccidioides posadasii str. Silveira]
MSKLTPFQLNLSTPQESILTPRQQLARDLLSTTVRQNRKLTPLHIDAGLISCIRRLRLCSHQRTRSTHFCISGRGGRILREPVYRKRSTFKRRSNPPRGGEGAGPRGENMRIVFSTCVTWEKRGERTRGSPG